MKTVLSLWKGPIPALKPTLQEMAQEEAERAGTSAHLVLCGSIFPAAVIARRRVINRMLAETGCTVSDLAKVWGVERKTLQRHIDRMAA